MMRYRTTRRFPWRAWATAFVLIAHLSGHAPGQEADDRGVRLEEMRGLIRAIEVTDTSRPARRPEPLSAEPLHRWSDPTREFSDGSLWAFGTAGRPVALATMELYGDPKGITNWAYELIALAPGPIVGESGGRYASVNVPFHPRVGGPLHWMPEGQGVEMREVADPTAPGKSESQRLRQMKAIANRITARETGANENDGLKTELRLMPRPIHRYADPDSGLVDGAFFLSAYGTNPELLVSSRAPIGRRGQWSCDSPGSSRVDGQSRRGSLVAAYADDATAHDPYHIVRTAHRRIEPSRGSLSRRSPRLGGWRRSPPRLA
ncbi:MAG: hypothetical protein WKF75_00805 [Singulisphaera sp.]